VSVVTSLPLGDSVELAEKCLNAVDERGRDGCAGGGVPVAAVTFYMTGGVFFSPGRGDGMICCFRSLRGFR